MAYLSGIIVPNIVPYLPDHRINEGELRRIVDWLIQKGVNGFYPNGSMGEFIRLSFEERKRVVEIIADEVAGRVPIMAGAAEANIDMVLEMCQHCADLGCRAVSLTGPYYYNVTQDSVETYFREIAARSPIDMVLYNIPPLATEISIPVLTRLALDCPRIIGTKDSSRDFCRFINVINEIKPQRPEFSVLIGWEELMVPALHMGADGGTLSTAGVAPELIMRIYKVCREKRWEEARVLQYELLELFQTLLQAGNFPSGFRAGYELRGFQAGPARYPNSPAEEVLHHQLRDKMRCLLGRLGCSEAECRLPAWEPKPTFGAHPEPDGDSGDVSHDLVARIVRDTLNKLR